MIRFPSKLRMIENLKNCKFREIDNHKSIDNPNLENDLFKLLIENKMNRFLFGYITRINTSNMDSLPLNEKLLDSNKLKEICGESCIKKFECPECGHLIYRKHLHDMGNKNYFTEECPNCSKTTEFNYLDLDDEFDIKRIDIIKFLERLVKINLFSKKLISRCNTCTTSEIINPEEVISLSCDCGDLREIKFAYQSNYDFLTESDGYWFEWYVFMLCDHIYGNVYQNYSCEFEINGEKRKCELDVLTISQDNKLTVYECKDHMKRLKGKLSMNDFMDNVTKIRHIADKIIIVSSLKNVKQSFKDETDDLIECEVEFMGGMDLEKQFLNEDSIINFFESQNYNMVPLYYQLSSLKRQMIFERVVELIIENECADYLNIANNMFNRVFQEYLVYPSDEILKDSLNTAILNISINSFVVESLEYIKNLYFFTSQIFDEDFDLNNILEICIPFLTDDPFQGYEKRAPFYYFITSYFRDETIECAFLDPEIIEQFLLKFVPMITIYYGIPSLEKTLNIFEKLWDFMNEEIENEFVKTILSEYSSHPGKRQLLSHFIKDKENTFSIDNRKRIRVHMSQ